MLLAFYERVQFFLVGYSWPKYVCTCHTAPELGYTLKLVSIMRPLGSVETLTTQSIAQNIAAILCEYSKTLEGAHWFHTHARPEA
jgi:hypothetical protein